MSIFSVRVTETLERAVIIHASNMEEALQSVRGEYKNEGIVLDSGDFAGVIFSAKEIREEAEKC